MEWVEEYRKHKANKKLLEDAFERMKDGEDILVFFHKIENDFTRYKVVVKEKDIVNEFVLDKETAQLISNR